MAPKKTSSGASRAGGGSAPGSLPAPFKPAPEELEPFIKHLSKNHVYIAHVDTKPRALKRKIFGIPILINVAVTLLFAWRMYYIGPYYLALLASALGYPNATTVHASQLTWGELFIVVLGRAFSFGLDFFLGVFVWPWPVEFTLGTAHGSPTRWRWNVGFRDREIYVRRSRTWAQSIGDVVANGEGRNTLLSVVRQATSPMLLQQKTGYLTMNAEWDLDWEAMVQAHRLVDKKTAVLDAFRLLVLLYHSEHGWIVVDTNIGANAKEDERRRQVFAFKDSLAAIDKEDLFYRWIEIIQFESSQPGGFGEEKQVEVAQKIRDLFQENDVDFDKLWKESVGTDNLAGII